jgi:hypothetical protein
MGCKMLMVDSLKLSCWRLLRQNSPGSRSGLRGSRTSERSRASWPTTKNRPPEWRAAGVCFALTAVGRGADFLLRCIHFPERDVAVHCADPDFGSTAIERARHDLAAGHWRKRWHGRNGHFVVLAVIFISLAPVRLLHRLTSAASCFTGGIHTHLHRFAHRFAHFVRDVAAHFVRDAGSVGAIQGGSLRDELAFVEVGQNRAIVGAKPDVGLGISGEPQSDLAIHRGERKRFVIFESDDVRLDLAVHGFNQRAAGNLSQRDFSVEAFHLEIAGHFADSNVTPECAGDDDIRITRNGDIEIAAAAGPRARAVGEGDDIIFFSERVARRRGQYAQAILALGLAFGLEFSLDGNLRGIGAADINVAVRNGDLQRAGLIRVGELDRRCFGIGRVGDGEQQGTQSRRHEKRVNGSGVNHDNGELRFRSDRNGAPADVPACDR